MTALVVIGVSLATAPPDPAAVEPFVYRRGAASGDLDGLPWYADYRWQFAALIAVTMIIVIAFW